MLSPSWFLGYDVVLEFIFAAITLTVASLGFRIYKKTSQKQAFYLAWAFMLMGISNLIQSVVNLLIISELNETTSLVTQLTEITSFNLFGLYVHMTFMLLGLSLLAFMTLKTKNIRALVLLIGLTLLSLILSKNHVVMFYALSALLLLTISEYYIKNFFKNKQTKTLLIAIAFVLLLMGSIRFLFVINHQSFYFIGHLIELVAYILVLINFFMVLKR